MKWPEARVSDYCLLAIDCVNKTAPVVETETPYRMIRTSDIAKGRVDLTNLRYVTEETFEKWTRRAKPQIGDVILSREAPIGNVGRITTSDNLFLGQRLFMYRTDPKKMDSRFLSYMLQSQEVQGRILSKGFGVTVQHIKVGDAENLTIPVPPLPVQKKIADVLSAYDELIEVNRRSIQLLEESARRLYKEWFVKFRFPNHEKVKMVDGLPDGWKRTTIEQVCDTLGGGTPSTTEPSYWQDGTIPWFTPKDLSASNCLILLDSEKKITEKGLKESSAKLFNPFTILMSSRASIGYFGLFDGYCASNQGFIAVVPKTESMRLYLLYNLISRKEEIEGKATGTTFKEISKSTFRALEAIEPTTTVLNAFNAIIWPILNQIQSLSKQTHSLEQIRDRLLPRLMSGTIGIEG